MAIQRVIRHDLYLLSPLLGLTLKTTKQLESDYCVGSSKYASSRYVRVRDYYVKLVDKRFRINQQVVCIKEGKQQQNTR